MIRINICPCSDGSVTLWVIERKNWRDKPITKCLVKQTEDGGVTSYLPLHGETSFPAIPKEYDDIIRLAVNAYFDGRNGRDCFVWGDINE